jgi:tetratricopeptide (TPR) repeat protein
MALTAVPVTVASANSSFYTYNYDFYDVQMESPDAYTPEALLLGSSLGIGDFKDPGAVFVRGNTIYIVDSGNNRIVEVDSNFNLIRVIDKVTIDGAESTFLNPKDIFVNEANELFICDSDNYRVLHVDYDLKLIKMYTKPEDDTFSAEQNFIPLKCAVDNTGRLYLLAANVNKGFLEFDKSGNFSQYIGANKVKVSLFEVIQKRLMTKAQRARMELFVPTEYSNLCIDIDNFIYSTTTTFDAGDLFNGLAAPIRRLNSLGEDILIRNGYEPPIGELWWDTGGDVSGPSRFEDITAMDNDTYYALDRIRGRVFSYDFQGNLLYVFGGLGNKFGYFQYPVSIDHMGTDLLILDNRAASLTRMTLTEYGSLINSGLKEYKEGRYEESADYWRQLIQMNGNYDLAYIGIGRALLRQERFGEAMEYFKAKKDFDNYSKAFAEYRKEWVEANVGYLVAGILALLLLPKLIRFIKKVVKGEVFK